MPVREPQAGTPPPTPTPAPMAKTAVTPSPYGKQMLFYDDPDIGMCDDCGTEDGDTRYRTIVDGTWDGVPGRCVAWLCGPCKRARNA